MADVLVDNQREHDAPSPVTMDEPVEKKQELASCDDSDNQQTSDNETSDGETAQEETQPTNEAVDVDIDAQEDEGEDAEEDEIERRLTWIGEGLLDGEGLDAVQQLMNLPSKPPTAHQSTERSGNKLLDFIAKEEGFGTKLPSPSTPESEAAATAASLPVLLPTTTTTAAAAATTLHPANVENPEELASPTEEGKRQNKLLDFLASDIGERYLDDVYQDEDRDDEDHEMIPEHTAPQPAHSNNKLLAFLARERGERVHEVEKLELADLETPQARRPEPYAVHIRFETEESAAAALAAEGDATDNERTVSPEPTPEATTITELDAEGNAVSPAQPQPQPQSTGERNKLTEFVKNVQPTSRPKFVIFNPDDLMSSSSSSEGEEGSSPKAGHARELRLKKRSQQQQQNGVRFANPGLDLQTGVIRQAVMDHYGREELLDFVAHVDENSVRPPPRAEPQEEQRTPTPPPVSPPTPPPRQESPPPPVRHESPHPVAPVRRDSPPLPLAPAPSSGSRKADGRLASFLRKFSGNHKSKSGSGSESGGSRASSRTNSPEPIDTRHSAPPPTHPGSTPASETTTSNGRPLQFMMNQPMAMPAFLNRTSVESEPEMTTPVEAKMGSSRVSFEPSPRSAWLAGSENGDPSSKRMALLSSLRLLLEDCEKNELSDIAMVRISILLSTVNQIVKEDLRKERPAQNIMRRLSMHVPGPNANAATAKAAPAPWVRSSKQQEEYERGHTTTAADIAAHVETKAPSPPARALSPQHTLSQVDEPVSDGAMTSFTEFETAQNLSETLHAYDALLRDCGLSESAARQPLRVYNQVKSALYAQCSFRQKQLFRLLDAKLGVDVYKRQPCLHKRVCVVGMGPVGLRAAVELALLGAQVVVIDKRKMFSRENILHMWPWVVQDLTSLGAKVFFPQFCHSSAYFHVGTRQLQCILLKVALLLGVKVHASTSFEGLASPDSIVSERKSFYTVVTKPQIPWMEFTAVLGACGTKDKLAAHANIKRFVFSRKEAIGLVCYFPNLGTNEEKKVKEFSWTIQFKQRMFSKMREIGIDLENVVYYRGEYHYIVMTPKRTNLLQQGVLKINYPTVSDLVGVDNIDPSALNDYVSRIINFFEIPQKSEFARVRLFDFSTRTRAAQAANVLSSRGKKLYVGLIGDALMEPFWPEGLGTCRGFLGAMDACWMVSQIGKQSDDQILADRELGYRIVQHISGFQRDDLQKNVRKYNVDPTSRYTVQYPATITY